MEFGSRLPGGPNPIMIRPCSSARLRAAVVPSSPKWLNLCLVALFAQASQRRPVAFFTSSDNCKHTSHNATTPTSDLCSSVQADLVGPRGVAVGTFTRSHPEQQGSEGASFRAGEDVIQTETPRLFVSLPHKRRFASGTGTGQLARERVISADILPPTSFWRRRFGVKGHVPHKKRVWIWRSQDPC